MKFPMIFRRESSKAAVRARQEQAEKVLAEALRTLGQVFSKLADVVEAQRLQRQGYAEQERFLERLDSRKK